MVPFVCAGSQEPKKVRPKKKAIDPSMCPPLWKPIIRQLCSRRLRSSEPASTMMGVIRTSFTAFFSSLTMATAGLPPNEWVQLVENPAGGRRGSALRYAPDAGAFLLWGFFDQDPNFLQEHPLMEVPEYDVVMFDPDVRRWQNHLPKSREREWSRKLPLAYVPRTYAAITTGSERTVLRGATDDAPGVPRPDLNIVFDQVAWHPEMKALMYFTGGLTA